MEFTETKGTHSDWSVQNSNEAWGTIISHTGKFLDLVSPRKGQCDINGCPVVLYSFFHGFFNQKFRRSGDKIVSAFPGYLAEDDSGKLVAISPNDGNKHWTRLEIGNIQLQQSIYQFDFCVLT